jgi:hypothetical protein
MDDWGRGINREEEIIRTNDTFARKKTAMFATGPVDDINVRTRSRRTSAAPNKTQGAELPTKKPDHVEKQLGVWTKVIYNRDQAMTLENLQTL